VEGGFVPLAGQLVDVLELDAVDAPRCEQLLARPDQAGSGRGAVPAHGAIF
jgi:hypothetical protein